MPVNRPDRKRKPRTSHAPYKPRKAKKIRDKKPPKTSAQPIQSRKCNDWMTVFAYIDEHPGLSQDAIVTDFKSRAAGALIFDQSTLSQKIKKRCRLEERVNDHPNALSFRRQCIVTHPDVERALFLWVKHMEEKGETMNGPMLVAKRTRFEDQFNVPAEEHLKGNGWLPKFKKAYNIKAYCRHGEAGFIDLAAVEAKRKQVKAVLAKYEPRARGFQD